MSREDKEALDAKIAAAEKAEKKRKKKEMREKRKAEGTSFFADFKKFITRGNVLDMAVGVIVGGAFTGIINGLSNYILKPLINWILALILGANSLDKIHTFLVTKYVEVDGVITSEIDLANSIYIDWGAFINAVINFFLIAITLFTIVRVITKLRTTWEAKVNADKIAQEKAAAEAKAAEEKAAADAKAQADAEAAEAARVAAEQLAERERIAHENLLRQTELLEAIAKKIGQ